MTCYRTDAGIRSDLRTNWTRTEKSEKRTETETLCRDGLSISSAKRTSYKGEAVLLSFCCLNVFTFLSVNIKDFYCAFYRAAATPPPPPPPPRTSAIYSFPHFFNVQGPKLTPAKPLTVEYSEDHLPLFRVLFYIK